MRRGGGGAAGRASRSLPPSNARARSCQGDTTACRPEQQRERRCRGTRVHPKPVVRDLFRRVGRAGPPWRRAAWRSARDQCATAITPVSAQREIALALTSTLPAAASHPQSGEPASDDEDDDLELDVEPVEVREPQNCIRHDSRRHDDVCVPAGTSTSVGPRAIVWPAPASVASDTRRGTGDTKR